MAKHLTGDDASLRELAIGFEVYERRETYDPKEDPIVRVEASRLRSRLREYYETAGPEEAIRIDIPKGSYVPTFSWRVVEQETARDAKVPVALMQSPETVAPPPPLPAAVPRSNFGRWAVGLGVAAVSAFLGFVLWPRPVPAMTKFDSIAVLPFADFSEKHDLTHLTDALTEQIQDELTRNRELRVVGSTSARQAAVTSDLREAARKVGVRALIQGSVQTEENKVRVTVRLLDGTSGAAVWSNSYDGDRKHLFEMEERIALAVAVRLADQPGVTPATPAARPDSRRTQANEYYQQARFLDLRNSAGPQDEAYRLYQLAISTDPNYAPAHAGLASVLTVSQGALGGPDSKDLALNEARKAIELDPNFPLGYAVLILYYRDDELNWSKAREACTSSLDKFPNSAQILTACGSVEGLLLHRERALQLVRQAVSLDPLSPQMHGALMFALYQDGKFDEALKEADFAIKNGPANAFLYRHKALILAAQGNPAAGLKVIEEGEARLGAGVPAEWTPVRGYLFGQLNRRDEARRIIRDFSQAGAQPHQLGLIYLGMGEKAKALEYYEKAALKDRSDVAHSIPEYYMRVLDAEPRFQALKTALGIPSI